MSQEFKQTDWGYPSTCWLKTVPQKEESLWCSHKKKNSLSQSEILNSPVVLLKPEALGASLIIGSCYTHRAVFKNKRAAPDFTHIKGV